MSRPKAGWWAAALPVAVLATSALAQEQRPPAQPDAAVAGPATETNAKPPPLAADDLDRLLEPFAGAPQDTLGVVLDACRYPSDLIDASRWAQQPEAGREPAKASWPATVRLLAERAPRTLDFLARDLAATSALGSAYQNQPNDVWLAYGRVTERRARAAEPRAQAAESGRSPRPSGSGAARTSAEATPAPPPAAPTPRPAPSQPAAPSAATAPAVQPAPQTVVVQPPADTGPSAAGAALAGGVVGLGAGLLISELAHDNDGWGHGYPLPYAVPPPYMPYGGGGGAYSAARDLQNSRISAAQQLQGNRQSFARESREDRQAFAAQQRQQRQAAESQQQAQRQSARAERQAQRQQSLQSSGPQRPGAGGAGRRDLATAGQSRLGERGAPAPRMAAAAHPAFQGGARPAGWGPAQGMSGDRLAAARARQPPGGFGGGHAGLRRR